MQPFYSPAELREELLKLETLGRSARDEDRRQRFERELYLIGHVRWIIYRHPDLSIVFFFDGDHYAQAEALRREHPGIEILTGGTFKADLEYESGHIVATGIHDIENRAVLDNEPINRKMSEEEIRTLKQSIVDSFAVSSSTPMQTLGHRNL